MLTYPLFPHFTRAFPCATHSGRRSYTPRPKSSPVRERRTVQPTRQPSTQARKRPGEQPGEDSHTQAGYQRGEASHQERWQDRGGRYSDNETAHVACGYPLHVAARNLKTQVQRQAPRALGRPLPRHDGGNRNRILQERRSGLPEPVSR
jgi:hypothetical protein